jgi:Ran GTPase-activating protein (RanGAP) involved in mRNA processing and transport
MHPEPQPQPFATNCHVGPDFTPCDPAELLPLLEHLRRGEGARQPVAFPRGTLLPDGRLDLCKQGIGPDGTRAVTQAVRGNPHVRHLLLGADGIGDVGAEAVAQLARDSDLQTLFLGCNRISATGAAALASAMAEQPTIRGLWIKRNPLGLAGARAIATLVTANRSLRTLDLVNTDLGPDGVHVVVEALLRGGAPIERLYLCGNRLTPADTPALADLLRRHAPLRHLYLSVNRLGDDGVAGLAPALADNRTLRTLSLASNGLGPTGAGTLADALRGHPALQDLDLGFAPSTAVLGENPNGLGDAGATALAGLLLDNPALRRLDLKNAAVTERGALTLLDALAANRTLTVLVLGKNLRSEIRSWLQELLARNGAGAAKPRPDPDLEAIRSVYRTAHPR